MVCEFPLIEIEKKKPKKQVSSDVTHASSNLVTVIGEKEKSILFFFFFLFFFCFVFTIIIIL